MKPPAFAYRRPGSVAEAVALMAEHGGDAKLLAGGQSLVPLLNFRVLRPAVLVDINRLAELDFVAEGDGGIRVGALTRHRTLETSPLVRRHVPLLAAAMAHVAHLAIRNRGTIGGSLAHADPAAELPLLAVLLDAVVHARSAAGGRRHAAAEFFLAPLTTALADDEIVTEIVLPRLPPRSGWAFEEVALRHGDFAIASVGATVSQSKGQIGEVRLAVGGVAETPVRLREIEAALVGERLTPGMIGTVATQARAAVTPGADLRASADYRRHLVGGLVERALTSAYHRAAA
jgi:aerobic carbon-monoxide dehydrogenase medium subunit